MRVGGLRPALEFLRSEEVLFLKPKTLLSYFNEEFNTASKLQERLIETAPMSPVSLRPKSLDGVDFPNLVKARDRELYKEFDIFASVINDIYKDEPWRLQERRDANIPDPNDPTFGPRYQVFYNQVEVGGVDIFAHHKFKIENPVCYMNIEIEHVRLLPFGQVRGFVWTLCSNVTWDANREFEKTIDQMLMEALWELDFNDSVKHCAWAKFEGSCENFLLDKNWDAREVR